MRIVRSLLTVAVAAGLAACVAGGVGYDVLENTNITGHCQGESPKVLNGINWSKAKAVNFDIRGGQFATAGVDLKVGQPTILRLANKDDTQHSFSAADFMHAVALEQVSTGSATLTRPCLVGFGIDAGKTAELRLVPMKAGSYYPEDSVFWYLGPKEMFSRGGFGIIVIRP